MWESLALANTMQGLATARRYTYHSLGALGVIELTAPWRAAKVAAGMRRLGFPQKARAYFDLHAVLDIHHARAWIQEIIRPLVTAQPECAQFIAQGALMRLRCGQLCFDRYSQELGLEFDEDQSANENQPLSAGAFIKPLKQEVAELTRVHRYTSIILRNGAMKSRS